MVHSEHSMVPYHCSVLAAMLAIMAAAVPWTVFYENFFAMLLWANGVGIAGSCERPPTHPLPPSRSNPPPSRIIPSCQ